MSHIDEPRGQGADDDAAQEAGRSNWGPGVLAAFLTFLVLELLVFGSAWSRRPTVRATLGVKM